jgi:hypothetical protein
MISKSFLPFLYAQNFKGVNSKDTLENILDGEWDENSINIYSDPQGAIGSRPGFSALTTVTIGASVAWCGFYQFNVFSGGSQTPHYIGAGSDGKLYEYASNAYNLLLSSLSTGADNRWFFFSLDNTLILGNGINETLSWSGTGSPVTFATSVTADFGMEWQRYGWLHSTADPRLLYYCATLGDPDTAYTSFLNFDADEWALTGVCKQGDDMIVGKQVGLYRVQYRGTYPLFKIYRVPSKVGPVSHWTMKELPDGRVIFLAPDFNFYMLDGDVLTPCGDNIKKIVKNGVNSRISKAVAGLLLNRSQYWCSFTYTSGATTNDRTLVMDWSRPYQDKFGKLQFPWFIYSIGANCFAEVNLTGKSWLYHGGYTGKMYKDDTGTNDDGVAFNATYASKKMSHGDPSVEKKYDYLQMVLYASGDWDLGIQLVCDGNAGTEKSLSQNLLTGLGTEPRFDTAVFDTDYFASESNMDITREIGRQGKLIQVSFGTTGLDESFLVYSYALHAKPLRRTNRTRES